jgi:hypothetical protein
LAACRRSDTLVVTKLDRLARSVTDARAIAAELKFLLTATATLWVAVRGTRRWYP